MTEMLGIEKQITNNVKIELRYKKGELFKCKTLVAAQKNMETSRWVNSVAVPWPMPPPTGIGLHPLGGQCPNKVNMNTALS